MTRKGYQRWANEWALKNREANYKGDGVFSQPEAWEAGFQHGRKLAADLVLSFGRDPTALELGLHRLILSIGEGTEQPKAATTPPPDQL